MAYCIFAKCQTCAKAILHDDGGEEEKVLSRRYGRKIGVMKLGSDYYWRHHARQNNNSIINAKLNIVTKYVFIKLKCQIEYPLK